VFFDPLSSLRARNVAAYLRSQGLKGSYAIRGIGVEGQGDPARRVQVTVDVPGRLLGLSIRL
jgi:hypothetical protein